MSPLTSLLLWCRQHLAWSNSPRAWQERLGSLGILAAAAALVGLGGGLTLPVQFVLWGVLAVLAALLWRRGWLKLFGPVLLYDMVRSARRGRYVLLRFAYAGLLFFVLVILFVNVWQYRVGGGMTQLDAAYFAQQYFYTFMTVQLVAVLLLTPAYVAGAVTEEKSKKTLEFLLATDLRSREIVLSKLVSRLANLTLFVLTGLPILSCVQFLGGVDPNLVLAGFAFTALTMFGLAGVGILCSVWYKETRDAIAITYLLGLGYYVVSLLLLLWQASFPAVMALSVGAGGYAVSVDDLVRWYNSGNLFLVMNEVTSAGSAGTLAATLPGLLRGYALFQIVVGVGSTVWATWRLRPVALYENVGRRWWRWRLLPRVKRPAVWQDGMLWKELHAEASLRLHWLGRIVCVILVFASFLPVGFIVWERFVSRRRWDDTGRLAEDAGIALLMIGIGCGGFAVLTTFLGGFRWSWSSWVWFTVLVLVLAVAVSFGTYYHYEALWYQGHWRWFAQEMGVWVRTMTCLVGTLFLLGVAVRASTCVSRERDKQTFDSLLTTPLSCQQIFFAKWLGNIVGLRPILYWLAAIWLVGLLTGGLSPFALPFLVGCTFVYAGGLSLLGCWCSMEAPTSLRATVYTLLAAVGLTSAHWLPWFCCAGLLGIDPDRSLEYVAMFQVGLTPPIALAVLPWNVGDFDVNRGPDRFVEFYLLCLLGTGVWLFGGVVAWAAVLGRFEEITNRQVHIPPRRSPPAGNGARAGAAG